jgi:hypothetical protein
MFDKNDSRHQGYFVSKDGKKKFDFTLRKCVSENAGHTKKQRRAFQRLMSGLTVGKSRRERLRFITLTSSPESVGRNLNADFRALKMRILRKFHFKMKYWKIRTNEGNGVLHVVYRGKYIPQKWLSEQWANIHKSPVVDIRSLRETKKGLTGMVFYLVGNYLAKQSFERMSWGYSWVFPAFVSSWKRLVEKYGFKRGLELWNRLPGGPLVVTRQVRLTGFLPKWKHTSEKCLPRARCFEPLLSRAVCSAFEKARIG